MNAEDGTTGLVLFGHGARDPRWREPFDRLLKLVTVAHPGPVTLAFLESMSPDLATAFEDLVARGATQLVVVPVFLGTGGHLRRDVPLLVEAAGETAAVPVRLCAAVGEDDQVLAAIAAYALRSTG